MKIISIGTFYLPLFFFVFTLTGKPAGREVVRARRRITIKSGGPDADDAESKEEVNEEEEEGEEEDEGVDTMDLRAEESALYPRSHRASASGPEPYAEQQRSYVGFGHGKLPPPRRRTTSGSSGASGGSGGRRMPLYEGIAGVKSASADAADAAGRIALGVPSAAAAAAPAGTAAGVGVGVDVTACVGDVTGPPSGGTLASVSADSAEGHATAFGQVTIPLADGCSLASPSPLPRLSLPDHPPLPAVVVVARRWGSGTACGRGP